MTEQGYIKSRFSPSDVGDWYNTCNFRNFLSVDDKNTSNFLSVDDKNTGNFLSGSYPNKNTGNFLSGSYPNKNTGNFLSDDDPRKNNSNLSSDDDPRKNTSNLSSDSDPRENTSNLLSVGLSSGSETLIGIKNRSNDWRSLILKRYKRCVITGLDRIECDAAHIVPFKDCTGENESWAVHKGNGLLLSKNLHWTFDRYYWSLDPNDVLKEEELYSWVRIVMRDTKRKLSIVEYYKKDCPKDKGYLKDYPKDKGYLKDYPKDQEPKESKESNSDLDSFSELEDNDQNDQNESMDLDQDQDQDLDIDVCNKDLETHGYVRVFKDNIPFLRYHYETFLKTYNQKKEKAFYQKCSGASQVCVIIKRRFDNVRFEYLYQCITNGLPFHSSQWLSQQAGIQVYGLIFENIVSDFNDRMDELSDPTWSN
jgi:hypothetical protein